jgi:lipoprotein NlpD
MHDGQSQLTASTDLNFPRGILRNVVLWTGLASALVLAGCSSTGTRAPVVDLSKNPNGNTAPATGGTYVVKPGDTLYKIARANNVDAENLKRWNNLTDPNQLVVGQVLRLSSNGAVASGGAVQSTPIRPATVAPRPLEGSDLSPKPLDVPPAASPPPEAAPGDAHPAPAADAGVIKWGWPASGKMIQAFNANTKGVDIEGASGDPVEAAADGKVMYSGNGVRGLGNLIIINHSNGFITAYAHNSALLVKTGAEVKRGAKIAEIGQTDAASPRLHFEVRRQGTPVDPMRYLPPR